MGPASRKFDAWQITTQGSEHGQDGRHDYLSLTFLAKEAGFCIFMLAMTIRHR